MRQGPNSFDIETLAKVDERTKAIISDISLIRDEFNASMSEINQAIRQQEDRQSKKIDELEKSHLTNLENMEKYYVKNAEFTPVQRIVYGMVGVIMTAVLVSLLTNVKYPFLKLIL